MSRPLHDGNKQINVAVHLFFIDLLSLVMIQQLRLSKVRVGQTDTAGRNSSADHFLCTKP